MTTLIKLVTSNGVAGRCDARCYNTTTDVCHCCCGGRNHGVGLRQAIRNTIAMAMRADQAADAAPRPDVGRLRFSPDAWPPLPIPLSDP